MREQPSHLALPALQPQPGPDTHQPHQLHPSRTPTHMAASGPLHLASPRTCMALPDPQAPLLWFTRLLLGYYLPRQAFPGYSPPPTTAALSFCGTYHILTYYIFYWTTTHMTYTSITCILLLPIDFTRASLPTGRCAGLHPAPRAVPWAQEMICLLNEHK